MNLLPVIMSGGSGSRLWPQSRSLYPKQFLPLINEQSMLQNTIVRLKGLADVGKPFIVANENHRFLVAEQLRQLDCRAEAIILEPVARNTAPAVAITALKALNSSYDDPILLVLAADHNIQDTDAFHHVVEDAMPAARSGKLVTYGIVPSCPETGYGYIKASIEHTNNKKGNDYSCQSGNSHCLPVMEFVEKPDFATAEKYLESGEYFWNSGIFMFKASRYIEELRHFRPDILSACEQAIENEHPDMDFVRLNEAAFIACPEESIDYAVMEKTQDAVVMPLDAGWSDVGSWSSLWDIAEKDDKGNVVEGDTILHDTCNSYIRSEKNLIAAVGIEDLVITESDDAILVAHKTKVQDVKKIVEKIKSEGRSEAKVHRKVYRPWGCYDSIDSGERYQVKRITVKPGAQLSLQKHYHRAEHWIVVKGTALVTNGDQEIMLTENQSTYIPIGVVHRLENPGKFDLELIEVQSGSYLGEDDIIRLEDTYGRD